MKNGAESEFYLGFVFKDQCLVNTQYVFLVPDETACQIAVEKALQTPASPDRFVPRCKEDGSFEDVQCSEFTGECWCVDSSGMEKRGTRSQDFITCSGMGKPILIMKIKRDF